MVKSALEDYCPRFSVCMYVNYQTSKVSSNSLIGRGVSLNVLNKGYPLIILILFKELKLLYFTKDLLGCKL